MTTPRFTTPTMLCALLAAMVCAASTVRGQAPAAPLTPSADRLYDTIKVQQTQDEYGGTGFRVRGSNDLEAVNVTLLDMIAFAYNLHPRQVKNAPAWAEEEHFDITMHYKPTGTPDDTACKQMIRQALHDRFGLATHGGEPHPAAYALHVEPSGPRLVASLALPGALPAINLPKPGKLDARNTSVADLATTLQRDVLDRPVIDETGITGRWDFQLAWNNAKSPDGKVSQPGLPEALKQELGLRLDEAKLPPSDLVVDAASSPLL